MTHAITYSGPCENGHPATFHATSDGALRVDCEACDADQPAVPVIVPPSAWSWREQLRRRWNFEGRVLL